LDELLAEDMLDGIFVAHIIPLMEFVELLIRPWLKKNIPDKYKVPMEPAA
jgi:hypothetical protein